MIVFFRKVENEIKDCRDPNNLREWSSMCQDLLRQSYGMNLLDMVNLLEYILRRRLKILNGDGANVEIFDGYSLGENHAKFDIQRIQDAARLLLKEFQHLEMERESEQCNELIGLCDT